WSWWPHASAFERRLRRSHVAPPSSVAKTPAAEIPTQSFFGLLGSDTMVCSTNPAAPGFQHWQRGDPSELVSVSNPDRRSHWPEGSLVWFRHTVSRARS